MPLQTAESCELMSGLGLQQYGTTSSSDDEEQNTEANEGENGENTAVSDSDSSESTGTDSEEDEEAAVRRQERKRRRLASTVKADSIPQPHATALPGLDDVDSLFAQTSTAILDSGLESRNPFVAPELDRAAEAERARDLHARKLAKLKAEREAAEASVKAATPAANSLRDIPGGVDHKAAGSAKDWKTKEKLKRDRGQTSRFKNYVEEEKRLLRQFEGNATGQS